MTKNLTSSLDLSRKYGLIFVFDQLRRHARTMKQCGDAEMAKFQELLNKVAPLEPRNRIIRSKRIEVETHLMPLAMALMLGNSDVILRCQKSLYTAIEQLQSVCIAAGKKVNLVKHAA